MAQIERWLVAEAGRIQRDRRTGRQIFKTIKQLGCVRGYSRLTDTIRPWRVRQASAAGSKQAYVPLAFAYSEPFQFDWSEEGLVIGRIHYRMQISDMTLCAAEPSFGWPTRVKSMKCSPTPTPEALPRWAV